MHRASKSSRSVSSFSRTLTPRSIGGSSEGGRRPVNASALVRKLCNALNRVAADDPMGRMTGVALPGKLGEVPSNG